MSRTVLSLRMAAMVLVAGMVACAPGCGRDTGSGSSTSASTTPSPPTSPSGSSRSPTASTTSPAGATTGELTLSGVIIEGVRPSCRILQVPDRRYALTGPDTQQLRIGQHVSVTGSVRPDMVTPCGTPFVVTSIGG